MKRLFSLLSAISLIFVSVDLYAQQYHQIRPGDTFDSIALKYQVSVDQLKAANPKISKCYTGLSLLIPAPLSEASSTENEVVTISDEGRVDNSKLHQSDSTYNTDLVQIEINPVAIDVSQTSQTSSSVSETFVSEEEYPKSEPHFFITYDQMFMDADSKFSMTFGFDNNILLNKYFYVGTGIALAIPSIEMDVLGTTYKTQSYNLEIPLKVGVRLCDGWLNLDTGPYMNIAVAGSQTVLSSKGEELDKVRFSDMDDLKRFSIGWEFNIHFCKFITVGINASLSKGSLDDNVTALSFGFKF